MDLTKITEVTKKNLQRLEKQKYSVDTRRELHLRELGLALAEYLPEKDEDFEELWHIFSENAEALELTAAQELLLCRTISEKAGDIRERIPLVPAKRRCRLSYVKNPLSDLAYNSFSLFFDRTTVSYADEFSSALEDVYHSISDYAILPIYSEKGGRLKSFCDLADKYELKKVLTCRVYSNTEDTETEFALFSKNCERFSGNRRKEVFFEFSLPDTDIMKAIAYLSRSQGQISRINTDDERAELCFEIPESEISALYIYLMLCLPDHEIKGIY